jgi:hypothetical protein
LVETTPVFLVKLLALMLRSLEEVKEVEEEEEEEEEAITRQLETQALVQVKMEVIVQVKDITQVEKCTDQMIGIVLVAT